MTPAELQVEAQHSGGGLWSTARKLAAAGMTDPAVVQFARMTWQTPAEERAMASAALGRKLVKDAVFRERAAPLLTAPLVNPNDIATQRRDAQLTFEHVRQIYMAAMLRLRQIHSGDAAYQKRLRDAFRSIANVKLKWLPWPGSGRGFRTPLDPPGPGAGKLRAQYASFDDKAVPIGVLGIFFPEELLIFDLEDLEMSMAHEVGHVFDSQMNPQGLRTGFAYQYDPKTGKYTATGGATGAAWSASRNEAEADRLAQMFLQRTGSHHPIDPPPPLMGVCVPGSSGAVIEWG